MKKLLIIEDEIITITLYKTILRRYNPDLAENVGIASKLLGENQYECVLSDLNLPDGSGIELIQMYKDKATNWVLVSAFGDLVVNFIDEPKDLKQYFLDIGFDKFIPKSEGFQAITKYIKDLLGNEFKKGEWNK